ncbi:NepR family anti-sigma factor [Yoonia sp. SS1-5]|uniref:NepR family anti-sigma factor n=1 Tax=Yoonia rhodophyticola TaxID=3137370 RepID=A0AAN0NIV2_9RHOB
MASNDDPKKAKIAEYIDENLKQVFSDLEKDEMPDQIVDLLAVLRAQDEELKAKK